MVERLVPTVHVNYLVIQHLRFNLICINRRFYMRLKIQIVARF
jgi:hypothetical protein